MLCVVYFPRLTQRVTQQIPECSPEFSHWRITTQTDSINTEKFENSFINPLYFQELFYGMSARAPHKASLRLMAWALMHVLHNHIYLAIQSNHHRPRFTRLFDGSEIYKVGSTRWFPLLSDEASAVLEIISPKLGYES